MFVHAAARSLGLDSASLALCADDGVRETVAVTDDVAAGLDDISTTLGEGPSQDALGSGVPVLVGQLRSESAHRRWPTFTPAALDLGVAATFAFPLQVGAIAVGLLTLHRRSAGELDEAQLTEAPSWQGAGLSLLLHAQEHSDGELPDSLAPDWSTSSVVHQATGMVMVQLSTDVRSAFAALRARAYGEGVPLETIARDIVSRRLRIGGSE